MALHLSYFLIINSNLFLGMSVVWEIKSFVRLLKLDLKFNNNCVLDSMDLSLDALCTL